jgi:transposase
VSKTKSETRVRTKRVWPRAFKLAAVSRMNEGVSVKALAGELGVRAELLYDWHRRYRSGGAEALRAMGRPSAYATAVEASSPASSASPGSEQRRVEELERKIGRQQLELDFFRAALRHVGEQRLKQGGSGGTASSR